MSEQARVGRQHPFRDDYGVVIAPDAVRLTRLLPGPIERVWAYLTESDRRARWLASGQIDLLMAGRVEHVFRNSYRADRKSAGSEHWFPSVETRMLGFVVACEPPRLLAYTWGQMPRRQSEVSFELSPRGESVLLVLTHRRLPDREDLVDVARRWQTHLGMLYERLAERPYAHSRRAHDELPTDGDRKIA
jgi:uncharacterized protein YndB with AHSA1/START domain